MKTVETVSSRSKFTLVAAVVTALSVVPLMSVASTGKTLNNSSSFLFITDLNFPGNEILPL